MDFNKVVESRYSCRAYSPRAVGRDEISAVLEYARLAPSACNRQPWKFIVIDRADDHVGRDAVRNSYSREWIASAPAYIVACGVAGTEWVRPFDNHSHLDVDLAIAIEHICLGATARGLATCWVCNFNPEILSADLGLPDGIVPVAIIPLGYPAEDGVVPEKKRKQSDEIVAWRD